jgi:hypothetical protein
LRAGLTAKFGAWLDQMLADEPPPRGIPEHLIADALAEEPSSNLYDLFSALTGLTGEIKLQGRAFKQLADLLAPLAEAPGVLARMEESAAESSAAILEALEKPAVDDGGPPVAFEQVCQVMIDLHDRLVRGLETCDQGIASLNARRDGRTLQRLLGTPAITDRAVDAVKANREAAAMTLARLVAALQDWGVQLIGRVGEQLDPQRMSAVDTRTDAGLPPGTVLVVNRSGYAINGNIKAVARVTVSQKQA